MKSFRFLTLVILCGSVLFISCKKSNVQSSYQYKLATTNRSNVVARVAGGNISWTAGYASANLLKFEAKNSGGTEVEFKNSTQQHVDLFSSLAQTLGTITLPASTYSEIEFKAELSPNGSDAALQLSGSFTSGGVTTPVVFTVNSALEIKTEKNNIVIDNNTSYTALTTLDLSTLTTGITEAMLNAATRTGGTIIISASSNTNMYNVMLANFDNCDEVQFEHD